jgi:hypothetical protein
MDRPGAATQTTRVTSTLDISGSTPAYVRPSPISPDTMIGMSDFFADGALVAGYLLAVPFTLYVPGFQRMWKRREPWVFATEQVGAALIVAGWSIKGNTPSAVVNAAWFLGFGAAFIAKGRRAG